MQHTMGLYEEGFEKITNGEKLREYRLYDEKRRRLQVGDLIEFTKLPEKTEGVTTRVIGLRIYKDWYSCYQAFFEEDLREHYESIEEAVKDTYDNWWPKEKEEKYGCVIIELERV